MTIENRILSFDIETYSLDPRKGFVWQSGFASFNNGNIEKSGIPKNGRPTPQKIIWND